MRIAVSQFSPGAEPAGNAEVIAELAAGAAEAGARLLITPEGSSCDFLENPAATTSTAQPLDGPFVQALLQASGEHAIAIAAGTFVPDPESGKVHNTLVIADRGEIRQTYRKVHLYDAFSFSESDTVAPGSDAPPVVTFTDGDDACAVGFATCYDLRFPELFRVLRQGGADVLALPAAWVVGPGKEEHWLTLLKARAIENTAYVVASDQVGRKGIGRSAAFDPFGLPLLDLGYGSPALGFVDVDAERIAGVRRVLPSGNQTRFRIEPRPH